MSFSSSNPISRFSSAGSAIGSGLKYGSAKNCGISRFRACCFSRWSKTQFGTASNRAPASKGRAVAGEKENTPEWAHVKEEEDDRVVLPPVVAQAVRTCKGAAAVVQ